MRPRGRRPITAALAVAAGLLGAAALTGCVPGEPVEPTVTSELPTETGTPVNLVDIAVGDCFDLPEGAPAGQALRLSTCDAPHGYEAYAVHEMPDGPFPPSSDITDFGKRACRDSFDGYVGGPYTSSTLDYTFIEPSRETWEGSGDRRIVCVLVSIDGSTMTGSAEGSGR